jgi:predicted PurR-regulated permease PerM
VGKFDLMKEIENSINNFFDHFSKFLLDAFSSIYSLVITLLYMVLLPLFSYYFIKDSAKIRDSLVSLFPSTQQQHVIEKGKQINQILGSFVRGQAIIVLILIVLYSTGLMILGVPFALVIGIFAGLGDIIPYFGTIVGLTVSVLVSLVRFQSPQKVILIFALFAVVKGSENWFFYPKIVGREIGLHFLWVLFSLIFFGQLFGFWGLVVAIPSAATFKVFLSDLVQYYKHSDYFREH